MKTKIILWISALLLLTAGAGCEKEKEISTPKFYLQDFAYFGCKEKSGETSLSTSEVQDTHEYIEYKGDKDGYLYIRHVNVMFNCCPDTLKATVSISGDSLIVTEREINPVCNCTCKYDLTYKIGPLSAQKYIFYLCRDKRKYAEFSFTYNALLESQYIIQKNNAL